MDLNDDKNFKNEETRKLFLKKKKDMSKLPVYDKDIFMKIQAYDWVFSVYQLLDTKDEGPLPTIGQWESVVKQSRDYNHILGEKF